MLLRGNKKIRKEENEISDEEWSEFVDRMPNKKLVNNNNEPYIFISYKSEDNDTAVKFRDILIKNGISCWMAPYSRNDAEAISVAIDRALDGCKCFVLLLTDKVFSSRWIRSEIHMAFTSNKKW